MNSTQLYTKKMVFTMNEQVFLLREVEKKVFLMHELVKFQTKTVP